MVQRFLLRLLLIGTLFCWPAAAQLPKLSPGSASTINAGASDDPLGRSTPRGAVKGFIEAVQLGDYEKAISYLDTKQRGDLARELARQLGFILDHETSIDLSNLSNKPEGDVLDNVQPNRDLVGVVKTSMGNVGIYVDRVQRNDNPPYWLFSSDTLRHAPDVYDEISSSDLDRHLPDWLVRTKFLTIPIWRWCAVLLAVPLVFLFSSLLKRLLERFLGIASRRLSGREIHLETLMASLRLLIVGMFVRIGSADVDSLLARQFSGVLGDVLIVVSLAWLAAKLIRIASDLGVARLQRTHAADRITMTQLLARIAQVLVVTFGGLGILYLVGINLTAALTGLGIGGLAVAFAAQKTLENLFGGIMLVSDRPIRIGDACKVGDYSGTVVDIGFRSTRLRTADRTVVAIPNGQLATMNIENYSLRDKYWFHPTVSLKQETTPDQMLVTLNQFRRLLENDTKVERGTSRVNFSHLGTSSLDVDIFAYVIADDYNEFMKIQEELLLRILGIVEEAGTALALPSQRLFVAKRPTSKNPTAEQSERAAAAKEVLTSPIADPIPLREPT
jgi:MscS family membrane protein